ncbi:hypothetical protein [Sphingopyxis sp. KK2]|uniref:hypothetical protein n=1 Tax=Sphingopyxis sp. KK2 TaxID=1855727 RepID=UPI0011818607|nr:hypothetical protein [Sphingopyxis sp. KK2]
MGKRKTRAWMVAATAFALTAAAPAALAKVTDAEKAANAEAMATGQMMYRYDQAAWHSTDALLAQINPADYPDLAGWVVEPQGDDSLLVTYFGRRDGPRYAIVRFVMRGSTVVEGGLVPKDADASLSPLANRLADARDAAAARFAQEKLGFCTKGTGNSVILPPEDDGPVRAYLMSSPVTAGVFPLGGHYRFDIDKDGKVASWRPFLNSCMLIDSRPDGEMEKKTAFYVSHLLDPQPTEIHYFVRYNVPVDMAIIMPDEDVWLLGIDGFTNPKTGEIALP